MDVFPSLSTCSFTSRSWSSRNSTSAMSVPPLRTSPRTVLVLLVCLIIIFSTITIIFLLFYCIFLVFVFFFILLVITYCVFTNRALVIRALLITCSCKVSATSSWKNSSSPNQDCPPNSLRPLRSSLRRRGRRKRRWRTSKPRPLQEEWKVLPLLMSSLS